MRKLIKELRFPSTLSMLNNTGHCHCHCCCSSVLHSASPGERERLEEREEGGQRECVMSIKSLSLSFFSSQQSLVGKFEADCCGRLSRLDVMG